MNKEILEITKEFHDTYEKLANEYTYETREDTKVFDINSNNGKLMYATVNEIVSPILKENKILRENAENNDKVVDNVNWENMLLKKENQELKSQLKGTTHCFDEEEHRKLQENYDRIYAENCKLREEHNINDISLLDENYRLKKGIDKAVEYIEWNKDKAKFDNNTKEYDNYTFLNEENINDLLDILNEVLE